MNIVDVPLFKGKVVRMGGRMYGRLVISEVGRLHLAPCLMSGDVVP